MHHPEQGLFCSSIVLLALAPALFAQAPCAPEWLPTFGSEPGAVGGIRALAVHDGGSGPRLYVAGGVPASSGSASTIFAQASGPVVAWNGSGWEAAGSAAPQGVRALCSYDDGTGAKLYAGGSFAVSGTNPGTNVAVLRGQQWTSLGNGGVGGDPLESPFVQSLVVFDDGSGAKLYIVGRFSQAGGAPIQNLAAWDGASFTSAGEPNSTVLALRALDLLGTPTLFVGGQFNNIAGLAVQRIAQFKASGWSSVGSSSPGGSVQALTSFDFGAGPELVAAGSGFQIPGVTSAGVQRWNGSQWAQVGQPVTGLVESLAAVDLGSGPRLYAGGALIQASGDPADRLARLEQGLWVPVGTGLSPGTVRDLEAFDFGQGPRLVVAGNFDNAGPVVAKGYATWDGSQFEASGDGLDGFVAAVTQDPFYPGALIAAGDFKSAQSQPLGGIGRFDGSAWSALQGGTDGSVYALATFDDGSGPVLIAGGRFANAGGVPARNIARFDGSQWTPMGAGLWGSFSSTVRALEVHSDGSGTWLYAAGSFTLSGSQPLNLVARWDGSLWQPVGGGLGGSSFATVSALESHDDGSGPRLYAGGSINGPGVGIARWDGNLWTDLDFGVTSQFSPTAEVSALVSFDDGSGPALFVGGRFDLAGSAGLSAPNIARWKNNAWSAVGNGLNAQVSALAIHDPGQGPRLVAGGQFTTAGGQPAQRLAVLEGNAWQPLAVGQSAAVQCLLSVPGPAGAALIAGGQFAAANSSGDSYLGLFACPPATILSFPGCFGPKPSLVSQVSKAPIGGLFSATISAVTLAVPLPLLWANPLAVDGFGCGLFVPGFGEILLSLSPPPIQFAQTVLVGGVGSFNISIPNNPLLIGQRTAVQALILDSSGSGQVELSNALEIEFTP